MPETIAAPTVDRTKLLPRSGIGVEAPWLVIAPPGNPIIRLEWRQPEALYLQTAFVRLMPNETINTFQRWHLLALSAQAAILK